MKIYLRGEHYWMRFTFEGKLYQRSTRLRNKRAAKEYAENFRARLHNEGQGFLQRESAPPFRDFAERFMAEIAVQCAAKPRTVQFYAQQMKALLGYAPLADARLNAIDEALISRFVQYRSEQVSPASVNRALATLRRALRLAHEWRLIERVPRIRLLKGERSREFVLNHAQEGMYLSGCPQPLRDAATLLLDAGLRLGEALKLQWADIHAQPVDGARFGYLFIRDGKSKYAKRPVPLTARVAQMLEARRAQVRSVWVFPSTDDPSRPWAGTSLDHLHAGVRRELGLPREFVLHCLRHTMLTRLGEAGADAFTIMRIAGHSSVTVSQRYVHPSRGNLERAFEQLEVLNAKAVSLLPQPSENSTESVTVLVARRDAVSVSH